MTESRIDRGLDSGVADGSDVQQVDCGRAAAGCRRIGEQTLLSRRRLHRALGWRGARFAIGLVGEEEDVLFLPL